MTAIEQMNFFLAGILLGAMIFAPLWYMIGRAEGRSRAFAEAADLFYDKNGDRQ